MRRIMLPYGRHSLDEEDVAAVVAVLHSDWLTTGPKVEEFEHAFAGFVGTQEAVAFSSGTAALHASMYALGVGPGDEVIVPAITFVATANCVVFRGGTPVFAEVDPRTLLLDPADVERRITPRTKAIIGVDYAGQPCEYDALRAIAERNSLALVADACHAAGARYKGRPVGSLADLNVFSLHPVKHFTTGEGGMVTTDDEQLARRLRLFRNHGIATDHRQRAEAGVFYYEMVDLGYNYRLTDFQCALGLSQLRKVPGFIERRRKVAERYHQAFAGNPFLEPLAVRPDAYHSYHLYVIGLNIDRLTVHRARVFAALRAEGIGVNVHYLPVHLHPYYRRRFGTGPGVCPVAESAYERILTLPIFPAMTAEDVNDVIAAVDKVTRYYGRCGGCA